MIYLAFDYGGSSLISKIIRWRTNSDVAHVELVFDKAAGLCFSAKPGEDVRFVTITNLDDTRYWKVVPLRGVDEAAMLAEAQRIVAGKPKYDMRGIIRFFAGQRQTDETRWFCSEICTHLAQVGGAFKWVKDCGISPAVLCEMALAREEAYE